jgi:hypothetical protein
MPLTISFSSNQTSIKTSGKIGKIAKAHDINIYRHFSIFYFLNIEIQKALSILKGWGNIHCDEINRRVKMQEQDKMNKIAKS